MVRNFLPLHRYFLAEVERCQQWFLKNVFYVPKFAPSQLFLKLSGSWSIDSEIGLRKLLFLGRLLTVVRNLFEISSILTSTLFLCEFCQVYMWHCTNMDSSVILTHGSQILCFRRIHNVKTKIQEFEETTWKNFVIAHSSYKLAKTCLDLVSPQIFWPISNQYPDLVARLHVQIRLMGNFGFSACAPLDN